MNNRALIHIRFLVLVLFLGLICPCAMGQEARSDFSRLSSKVIKGDADNDGVVNVNDVMTIVNYILGATPAIFNFENADTNKDGEINILDVMAEHPNICRFFYDSTLAVERS